LTEELLTEQEQIEQLKNWIKQYGLTVLAGVVIALIMVSCWRYYQRYQDRILTHASGVYDEMLTARAQNDAASLDNAKVQAGKLLSDYPKTPYAQFAAFTLARDAVAHQNYPEALKQLNWVLDHGTDDSIRQIAEIRMARILITENKAGDALATLEKVYDTSFKGLIEEVKGDAYLQQKDYPNAKAAYHLALTSLPKEEAAEKPLLQMKLDNLATANDIA
jgi:predicted negative regulator of RcsB-dependent stress response